VGKFLGVIIGYLMGGFWGLLIGLALGAMFDRHLPKLLLFGLTNFVAKHQAEIQRAFFESTFTIMGHIAKADGRVSEEEIKLARQVMQRMNLDETATREAMRLFGEGKSSFFDLETQLHKLNTVIARQPHLCQMFIEIQLGVGFADGDLDAAERAILLKVCAALGLSEYDFARLENAVRAEIHAHRPGGRAAGGMPMDDAYAILGIESSASDAEVKKAYRRLMSQHHPDKLAAKGLPKEMMKIAEQKTHEIRTAYERIREQRGFK